MKMRPPRLMWREIARRAASIWRAVRRPRSVAFKPKSPNDTFGATGGDAGVTALLFLAVFSDVLVAACLFSFAASPPALTSGGLAHALARRGGRRAQHRRLRHGAVAPRAHRAPRSPPGRPRTAAAGQDARTGVAARTAIFLGARRVTMRRGFAVGQAVAAVDPALARR